MASNGLQNWKISYFGNFFAYFFSFFLQIQPHQWIIHWSRTSKRYGGFISGQCNGGHNISSNKPLLDVPFKASQMYLLIACLSNDSGNHQWPLISLKQTLLAQISRCIFGTFNNLCKIVSGSVYFNSLDPYFHISVIPRFKDIWKIFHLKLNEYQYHRGLEGFIYGNMQRFKWWNIRVNSGGPSGLWWTPKSIYLLIV